jgi:hypothetical protein
MSWNCQNCFQGVSDDRESCHNCGYHKGRGLDGRPGPQAAAFKRQQRDSQDAARRGPTQGQSVQGGTLNAGEESAEREDRELELRRQEQEQAARESQQRDPAHNPAGPDVQGGNQGNQ